MRTDPRSLAAFDPGDARCLMDQLEGQESDGQSFNSIWLNLDKNAPDTPPLYPDGLIEMLANGQQTSGADGVKIAVLRKGRTNLRFI